MINGFLILTYEDKHDLDVIRKENGDPMIFDSLKEADSWQ